MSNDKVKRYWPDDCRALHMEEAADGGYVDYADYLALAKRVRELESTPPSVEAGAVPKKIIHYDVPAHVIGPGRREEYANGWNSCRDAMLAAAPTPPANAEPKQTRTRLPAGTTRVVNAATGEVRVVRSASAGGLDKGRLVKIAAELLGSGWASDVEEDWPNRVSSAKVAGQAAQDKERRRLMAIELREIFDIAQGGAQ